MGWRPPRRDVRRGAASGLSQLRQSKNVVARASAAAGREARADQGAVWDEIAAKRRRLGGDSPTDAMHDVFESPRATLDELTDAMSHLDGQLGALVAIGGQCTVIDMVSRADVWAALHRPLVQGYALDALDASQFELPEAADPTLAQTFLDRHDRRPADRAGRSRPRGPDRRRRATHGRERAGPRYRAAAG